jgi:hypothetical protein
VPLDSVQEFSVISNNFSAQFGRASGGIVNVITKSGTNAFRGSLYDFYRSDVLTSNTPDNIANDIPKGQYKRTQSGFSLGGPVLPDKLLFFASLERIGVKSNDTQITWVPTPELLAASSPATRAFFAAYGQGATINGPVLTRGDVSAILGPGAGAFSSMPAATTRKRSISSSCASTSITATTHSITAATRTRIRSPSPAPILPVPTRDTTRAI